MRLGPYEVIAPIGAGGMGEVYRAKDSRLGRGVAIRVIMRFRYLKRKEQRGAGGSRVEP